MRELKVFYHWILDINLHHPEGKPWMNAKMNARGAYIQIEDFCCNTQSGDYENSNKGSTFTSPIFQAF